MFCLKTSAVITFKTYFNAFPKLIFKISQMMLTKLHQLNKCTDKENILRIKYVPIKFVKLRFKTELDAQTFVRKKYFVNPKPCFSLKL